MMSNALCSVCEQVNLDIHHYQSPYRRESWNLGHITGIKDRNCPLCKLVYAAALQAYRNNRHVQITAALDGDKVTLNWSSNGGLEEGEPFMYHTTRQRSGRPIHPHGLSFREPMILGR